VEINIFSMNGQLVKKLEQRLYIIENGGRESCIQWDGRGENGASLGKGIYLYSVKISKNTLDGQIILGESPLKKLVLLK
jgi:flagellar hook assembly protein FlgD